jgi:hypothetical protein
MAPRQSLFLIPWYALSDDRAAFFEEELARELAPHHSLHNRHFTAEAKTGASDDVLYRLDDGTFAQVHLKFTKEPRERPPLPRHHAFETLADWMIERMLPDHIEYFGLWPDGGFPKSSEAPPLRANLRNN